MEGLCLQLKGGVGKHLLCELCPLGAPHSGLHQVWYCSGDPVEADDVVLYLVVVLPNLLSNRVVQSDGADV